MRKPPPAKRKGQARGNRTIDGEVLDLRSTARFLGITEHTLRARVSRRLVPFRKWGARIIFLRSELVEFFRQLPGCPLEEVRNTPRETKPMASRSPARIGNFLMRNRPTRDRDWEDFLFTDPDLNGTGPNHSATQRE